MQESAQHLEEFLRMRGGYTDAEVLQILRLAMMRVGRRLLAQEAHPDRTPLEAAAATGALLETGRTAVRELPLTAGPLTDAELVYALTGGLGAVLNRICDPLATDLRGAAAYVPLELPLRTLHLITADLGPAFQLPAAPDAEAPVRDALLSLP